MNNTDIQKARKWAKEVSEEYSDYITVDSRAAIKVIQSLPDQWVDAEKVREIYDRYRASEITLHEAFRAAVALTAPPLPTLAELIEQGNEWHKYLRFQCDVGGDRAGVVGIVSKDVFWISYDSGFTIQAVASQITPLPDLPRLEWPGSGDAPTVAEQENVAPDQVVAKDICNNEEESLPCPEDVPEGEVWMIRTHENADPVAAFRVHASKYGPGKRWAHYRVGGSMLGFADDEHVTLVSRLVPEVKP